MFFFSLESNELFGQAHYCSGSARVEGDDDEDGDDDIYKELNYYNLDGKETVSVPDPKLYGYPYVGQSSLSGLGIPSNNVQQNGSNIPLLTYGEEVRFLNVNLICSCLEHIMFVTVFCLIRLMEFPVTTML